jgi:protein N-terminal methyltransferase
VIVVKENHSEKGFLVDKEDYSVTRSEVMYRGLIERAGLRIVKEQRQDDWPESLFSVKMYAMV